MDVISHFIKVTRCHYSWWNLVEPINGFWREICVWLFGKAIYQIFGIWYHLLFFEKELPKTKNPLLPLSQNRNSSKGKGRIFLQFFFIASTLRIKGGDRETTLELGIHKAWSFHPFSPLAESSSNLELQPLFIFFITKLCKYDSAMLQVYYIFILLYFICLIFPWDI